MNLLTWLHFPIFLLLIYLLWRSVQKGQGLVFWSALFFKLSCGLLLGWVYQNYLNLGDTWTFHAQTQNVAELAKQDAGKYLQFMFFNEIGNLPVYWKDYSNSFFFLKPLSLLYLLTNNSYWWSGLYLSLFSFWGAWFLVQQIRRHFPAYGTSAFVVFLFFPSVVFWTSGVLKEPLFMGGLCLTVGMLLQLYKASGPSEATKKGILLLPCLYLIWRMKFFLAAILIVLMVPFLLTKWLARRFSLFRSGGSQYLAGAGLIVLGAFVGSFSHPAFDLDFFVNHLLYNYQVLTLRSDPANPLLHFPDLQPTLLSVLLHAPSAVVQMLFRPFIWEPSSLVYKLMAVENLFLFLLVLLTLIYLFRTRKVPALPSFLGVLLVFFFISAVLVTLPTPNLGSLHRYRAPLLPFFFLVVIAWGPIPTWLQMLSKQQN
ncbi:hypothetical protein [Rufibacter tibetensis]|uniref:Glycosyltransferase RgtA/B/C/D-like domain-containing protein n=1 Tax=Rufibacter tibetensis TaxID=512763 RepID=A0A0P0CMP1_9BACT|nr:hypothetical protein [Rufibacter tibetensis]ALI98255.1 hypothetical protein DC20_03735 [Rufibacter tibetensis]